MSRSKARRLDTLLIIRGLLAVSVVIWHFVLYKESYPAFMSIPGRTAVWIFFGISGYVISYGFFTKKYLLNAEGLRSFYINRVLRIYPLFLLLSILGFLAIYFTSGQSPIRISDIPSQLLMLQFNHDYVLNSVFWTLGIEMQFYLLAPLFAAYFLYPFKAPLFWYGLLYVLLLCWLPAAYFLWDISFDGRNLLSNLTHFLAGMIGCRIVLQHKQPAIKKYILVSMILLLLIVTNYLYRDAIKWYWTVGSAAIDVLIFFAILLHHSLSRKIVPARAIGFRTLSFLGVISYGIYAWHPYLSDHLPVLRFNLIVMIMATILLSFISYRLVEKPALRMKRAKTGNDIVW